MARGALALEQARRGEQQRARTHGRDVARREAELAHRRKIGRVLDGVDGSIAAGHDEQAAFVDVGEPREPCEAQSLVRLELAAVDGCERAARIREAREHFERSGEVELGDARIQREDDGERLGHTALRVVAAG